MSSKKQSNRSAKPHVRDDGKVAVSTVLNVELVEKLQNIASKEHRSRNSQIEYILEQWAAQPDANPTHKS
jgi:hypothetical protein